MSLGQQIVAEVLRNRQLAHSNSRLAGRCEQCLSPGTILVLRK